MTIAPTPVSTDEFVETPPSVKRPLLLIEQTLGHRTHGMNLEAAGANARVKPRMGKVNMTDQGRIPLPWAIRGSWQAVRKARRAARVTSVTFYHTQTVSLFAPLGPKPYVVSTDATPVQLDTMGSFYSHRAHPKPLEWAKRKWYSLVLNRAAAVVSWSQWAGDSLIDDYKLDRDRLKLVAHPGAPASLFAIERGARKPGPVRILFVGGEFDRKGGRHLLEAFEPLKDRAELVIMTETALEPREGVRVELGIRPHMERFREIWEEADIFCLPTLGDCTPIALGEALAAGLPVVTTRVGSNEETIRDGETGLLVPVADPAALSAALARLVDDAALRTRMSHDARMDALERMDALKNARRILALLDEVAECK